MMSFARARFGAAVAVAFFSGLVFASGLDLTRFSWAQGSIGSGPSVSAPQVASLAETEDAFEAIVDRVKPAVVSIEVERFGSAAANQPQRPRRQQQQPPPGVTIPPGLQDFFREFPEGMIDPRQQQQAPRRGSGSGFIVSRDGYILTNNHVIADMDRVMVTLVDHRKFEAKVVGRDPTTDVAVIKIEGSNFPFISFGDDATAKVGQWVLAIGNPLDLDFTVTAGIVSAKGRNVNLPNQEDYAIQDFIQTDAAINPGNSGGPLVNIRGQVIGINSAIATGTGYYAGYGFAIPIGLAKIVMDDLIEHGRVRRAVVGVNLEELTPEHAEAAGLREIRGTMVSGFTDDNSPAKRAGVRVGDVIVGADGKPVESVSQLQRVIRGYKIGQSVTLDIQRFGERKQVAIKLTEATPLAGRQPRETGIFAEGGVSPRPMQKLGVSVRPVTASMVQSLDIPDEAATGLVIADIDQRGVARGRLFQDDIIEEVIFPTKRDIKSAADLESALAGVRSGQVITIKVYNTSFATERVVSLRMR